MRSLDLVIDRPPFRELRWEKDKEIPEQYDMVQLKMDGIWGHMKIGHGQWAIYSRTGKMKADGVLEDKTIEAELLGEFMFGSHWGHKMGKNRNFYVFDCVNIGNTSTTKLTLKSRLSFAKEIYNKLVRELEFIHILDTYKTHEWKDLWNDKVEKGGYEGLVFKDGSSRYLDSKAWARMKAIVEIDYICTGFRDADVGTKYEGQVGGVIGTLIDKDVMVTVSGINEDMRKNFTEYPERYVGQVFTAKGNNWYPSGAIRHPQFVMWRTDKEVDECRYDQIPEGVRTL